MHNLFFALDLLVGQANSTEPSTPPLPSSAATLQLPLANDNVPQEKKEANGKEGEDDQPKADERWFLMKMLNGTRFGDCLTVHKIQVSGWTQMSFTASSARNEQLPIGFNYHANDFLLQKNWLRIERPVDTESKFPSFGFRADTILPGSDYRFTAARGLFDGQLTA